jgi:hypothetical protein
MAGNPNPVVANAADPPPPVPPVAQQPNVATLTLTPLFKLVFASVLGLTILSLGVSVFITFEGSASPYYSSLNEKVSSVFTLGCGAIIGLLGGKTLS